MCGRYDSLIPREAYERLFGAADLPESNFPPHYNIAPTQDIAIVRLARAGHRKVEFVRWGLIPFYMKEKPKQPHINARGETVDRTPLFREAFARRRCLIPATGFFEWLKEGKARQPFRFVMKDREPFAIAGIWESALVDGQRIHSAAIIVTAANALVAELHDRMPVILDADDYERWLQPEASAAEAKKLIRPFPAKRMESYPVSRIVNSYENDTEECIAPITLEAQEPVQRDLLG